MLMRTFAVLGCALLLVGVAFAIPPVLTLHVASYTEQAPVVDGKLDDACWQTAPKNSTFYQYWTLAAKPTPLQTTFQFCYNEKGLYLGIALYEKDMRKLKATSTQHGDQMLWADDCVELYYDSNATSIGFRKFVVNALATQASSYRMDASNVDATWNPDGWQVATSKDDKAWYIEGFFPWSDLGRSGKEGDLWRFALCRYSWSSGNLASSAVGASYNAPECFGWLLFLHATGGDRTALAKKLQACIPGDWLLPLGEQVVLKEGNTVAATSMQEILTALQAKTRTELETTKRELAGTDMLTGDELTKQLDAVAVNTQDPIVFQQGVASLANITSQLDEWKYGVLLKRLVTTSTGK